jgi:hypothetical protein
MKMRPILFSAPMVRALLGDRKTMTRRAIKKPEPTLFPDWFASASWEPDFGLVVKDHEGKGRGTWTRECPYGQPGDILWVRETFATDDGKTFWYRADGETYNHGLPWKPSIHMPYKAARIFLQITGVRVERLGTITEGDAYDEGAQEWAAEVVRDGNKFPSVRHAFQTLWESINGKGSWDANPWVWVVEFRRMGPDEVTRLRADLEAIP